MEGEVASAHGSSKRPRDDTSDISPYSKRFREAEVILGLETADEDDFNSSIDQLQDVIKSLEEEIATPKRPDYEYLLEASDDELGIPPAVSTEPSSPATDGGNFAGVEDEGFDRIWGFEDDVASFLETEFFDGVCFDGLEFAELETGRLNSYY